MNHKPEQIREMLQQLTVQDFLNVGLNQVAYIRPARGGEYSVYAADGSLLSLAESFDMAIAAVRHNDMQPVTVH
jgi:hypothetical protein